MDYFIYIYISAVLASLSGGFVVWRQIKDASGFFFFIFSISASIWFFIFSFSPTTFFPDEIQLTVSRLLFCSSTLAAYGLFYFLYFYGDDRTPLWSARTIFPFTLLISLVLLYIFTDLVIVQLLYDTVSRTYHEVKGSLFAVHISAHFACIFLFFDTLIRKIKTQNMFQNTELKNILLSTLVFSFSLIVLKIILPFLQLWIGEKEIVFLSIVFLVAVLTIIRRNYFSRMGDRIGQIFLYIAAAIGTFLLIKSIKYLYNIIQSGLFDAWMNQSAYFLLDILGLVLVYMLLYWIFRWAFLGNYLLTDLFSSIENLKKSIASATDMASLNDLISYEMNKTFKPHSSSIQIYNDEENTFRELRKYFDENNRGRFFINDDLFIEQNRRFYDVDVLRSEIPKDSFLIFPLYDAPGKNIGIFILGAKRFGDAYTKTELDVLGSFSHFLEMHLKYMGMHVAVTDLSTNLDKKVNEKVSEYNMLIDRQKEFIGVISHEIRSPLSAAIFQTGSIVEDMGSKRVSRIKLKNEIALLNTQLVRTGGLLSKLFSVQYHDTHDVELVREDIAFRDFLVYELEYYSQIHTDVAFHTRIDENIGIISIDRVQFQQVLSNLLENAIKFFGTEKPVITLSAYKEGTSLIFIVEDNGKGFEGINTEDVFDKYATGKNRSIGLGMGLYLSKKIVELHHGTIEASVSERHGGAKFTISIPVK